MDRLGKIEAALAGLITLAAVWLHSVSARSAGGLWRDEANTVGLATLPSLNEVWHNLQYDSFPMLWVLLVRAFANLSGPMNDVAFRGLGLAIGLAIIAALWSNARAFGHRYPLVSLSLFALSPSVIRYGDSLRAYGLGMLLALLTCAQFWKFVREPGRKRFAITALLAVLSVQTLYYNAIVVLALGAGAVAVCALNRQWKRAMSVVAIGSIAAISLLPYVSTIRSASSWNALVQIPDYDLPWFLINIIETLSPGGPWAAPVWFCAFFVALWASVRESRPQNRLGLSSVDRELVIFGGVTLTVSVVAHFLFLRALSYVTQPWYYLTLLTMTAFSLETIFGVLVKRPVAGIARLAVAAAVAIATVPLAQTAVRQRMTNVDLISARLNAITVPGDVVIVNPWYIGVSFARYYHGRAEWMPLPDVGFSRFHRYDLLAPFIVAPDQTTPARPSLEAAERALRSGKAVYVVGGPLTLDSARVDALPPTRMPDESWMQSQYQDLWTSMLTLHVRSHARDISDLKPESQVPIGFYENPGVAVARGWRD